MPSKRKMLEGVLVEVGFTSLFVGALLAMNFIFLR